MMYHRVVTRVSKEKVEPTAQKRLLLDLWEGINGLNSRDRVAFLEVFFTPAELKMFSKRLAGLKMLYRGNTYQEISQELKITPTTISRLSNALQQFEEFLPKIVGKLS